MCHRSKAVCQLWLPVEDEITTAAVVATTTTTSAATAGKNDAKACDLAAREVLATTAGRWRQEDVRQTAAVAWSAQCHSVRHLLLLVTDRTLIEDSHQIAIAVSDQVTVIR